MSSTLHGPTPMADRPSVGRAVSWAFDTFKREPLPFIALAAVVAVLQTGMNLALQPISTAATDCQLAETEGQIRACEAAMGEGLTSGVLAFVVLLVLGFLAEIGIYRAAIAASVGVKPTFSMLWRTNDLGRYVATTLLMMLFTFLGLLACLIPGLILAFLMQLAPYYVLDRGLRPMAAIKASIAAVRAHLAPALLMVLFVWLVLALGGALWGLLTLVTLPFATLFIVHMYRQFNGDAIS